MQRHREGQLDEARRICRQAVEADPKHAGAWFLLGELAIRTAELESAVDFLGRALKLSPYNAAYLSSLGEACRRLGRTQEAEHALRRAAALGPHLAEPCFHLGLVLEARGQVEEAAGWYGRAAELMPDNHTTQYGLAGALQAREDLAEAIAHYEGAVALHSDFVKTLIELAGALRLEKRFTEAAATYRRAFTVDPRFALAHNSLGTTLLDLGHVDEAIACLRRSIELWPEFAGAHNNLGNALKDSALLDQAIAAYRTAVALDPEFSSAHSNVVYLLPFHTGCDSLSVLKEARLWSARYAAPRSTEATPHENECSPERRLRIGYVSPDFMVHCQAHFMLPLLQCHDHELFEIVCYSSVLAPDRITVRLREHADLWRDVARVDDVGLAQLVREDGVDVLVDLTMHMARGRLKMFALRPAPVQICWLAYPGTTGLDAIQYRISDRYLDPPELGIDNLPYSEKTIRLADTFWCYDPLNEGIEVGPLPASTHGFVTFGQFNSFAKVNEDAVALWARVLRAIPHARLCLLAPAGSPRRWIRDVMHREHVREERIVFVDRRPRAEYLAGYRDVDICLDCVPYNGHTTSLDALWMGVPIVTLVGRTVVGRAGLSQAMNLGLPDLVATTPDEYVRVAAELATNLPRLAGLRARLRARMEESPLMDAPRFARELEAAYRGAWRRWAESVRST